MLVLYNNLIYILSIASTQVRAPKYMISILEHEYLIQFPSPWYSRDTSNRWVMHVSTCSFNIRCGFYIMRRKSAPIWLVNVLEGIIAAEVTNLLWCNDPLSGLSVQSWASSREDVGWAAAQYYYAQFRPRRSTLWVTPPPRIILIIRGNSDCVVSTVRCVLNINQLTRVKAHIRKRIMTLLDLCTVFRSL